jgi:hypothetical protein
VHSTVSRIIVENEFLLVFRPTTGSPSSILSIYTCLGLDESLPTTAALVFLQNIKANENSRSFQFTKTWKISFCLLVYLLFQEDPFNNCFLLCCVQLEWVFLMRRIEPKNVKITRCQSNNGAGTFPHFQYEFIGDSRQQ